MERLLIVDDEAPLRELFCAILTQAGYQVATAVDGFDALLQMRTGIPDILISDLNMPRMSGFELLSVVRRRFPEVGVLAMSGAFNSTQADILADHFFSKNGDLRKIVEIVRKMSALRLVAAHRLDVAPVWIPRNTDSRGVPYVVLTCTQCLRSFPLSTPEATTQEIKTTSCIFCDSSVAYIIDLSIAVVDIADAARCKDYKLETHIATVWSP